MLSLASLMLFAAAAEPVDEEITVFGSPRVIQARQDLMDQLTLQGFSKVKRRDGKWVLLQGSKGKLGLGGIWKGKIELHDSGLVQHKRRGLHGVLPTGWVGPRKLGAFRSQTIEAAAPQIRALGDRMADDAVASKLDWLPQALQELWDHGTPIDGGPPLKTHQQRRSALLQYWESRTETVWGQQVRNAVQAFLRGVVQPSEHPFTEEEIAVFNAQSRAKPELML